MIMTTIIAHPALRHAAGRDLRAAADARRDLRAGLTTTRREAVRAALDDAEARLAALDGSDSGDYLPELLLAARREVAP